MPECARQCPIFKNRRTSMPQNVPPCPLLKKSILQFHETNPPGRTNCLAWSIADMGNSAHDQDARIIGLLSRRHASCDVSAGGVYAGTGAQRQQREPASAGADVDRRGDADPRSRAAIAARLRVAWENPDDVAGGGLPKHSVGRIAG